MVYNYKQKDGCAAGKTSNKQEKKDVETKIQVYAYRASCKDNLSNILICSILAMTRRKAEGELSDESVDLCTSEQREG